MSTADLIAQLCPVIPMARPWQSHESREAARFIDALIQHLTAFPMPGATPMPDFTKAMPDTNGPMPSTASVAIPPGRLPVKFTVGPADYGRLRELTVRSEENERRFLCSAEELNQLTRELLSTMFALSSEDLEYVFTLLATRSGSAIPPTEVKADSLEIALAEIDGDEYALTLRPSSKGSLPYLFRLSSKDLLHLAGLANRAVTGRAPSFTGSKTLKHFPQGPEPVMQGRAVVDDPRDEQIEQATDVMIGLLEDRIAEQADHIATLKDFLTGMKHGQKRLHELLDAKGLAGKVT